MSSWTPELVAALWRDLPASVNARVRQKATAPEMLAAQWVLTQLQIPAATDFMTAWVTTLGAVIYIPFDPGVASEAWSLESQALVCPHECEHVVEAHERGIATLAAHYAFGLYREEIETRANIATQEAIFATRGHCVHPSSLAAPLGRYGCSETDVRVSEAAHASAIETLEAGGQITTGGRKFRAWLEANAPDLILGHLGSPP